MRYTNGTKNNDVTAVVRADGLDCPELRRSSAGSSGQCWIAVKSGQAISVFCDLKLEASQYQVDLVVDGVLRNIVVSTVCPRNEDREEIVEFFEGNHKHFRSLFRSPMITSRIPEPKKGEEPIVYDDSDNTRVGTIEILVYKYDMGYNHTRPAELPENVVDWEDLEGPAGCSGIQPTHEVVMATKKRLNDTERRTWKNKSEKLPMGHAPWASFKFLYRHETSLQGAELIDRRLNVVPTAAGLSSLRKDLLSFHSSEEDSSTNDPRFNNNPWVVRERNGLREYKQIQITPSQPGPQIISTKRVPKRPRLSRKSKKPAKRRSSRLNDDLELDLDDDSADESNVGTPNKRLKPNVDGLRAEVEQLQAQRDEARRNLEEQIENGVLKSKAKNDRAEMVAHKEALQREIDYINIAVGKYKERDDVVFDGQDNPMDSTESSDESMMIDPALLTPERLDSGSDDSSVSGDSVAAIEVNRSSDHDKQVSKKPASKQLTSRSRTTKDLATSNDTSASGAALTAGRCAPVNGAAAPKNGVTTDEATAVNAAAKNLAIIEDAMAADGALAGGEASDL
ncbi:hypothetical protein G7Y79_00028g062470 [Physcia stellaris]|nr:hypothetical protein G7Y79_00028g062470 [Physcia stellaris]